MQLNTLPGARLQARRVALQWQDRRRSARHPHEMEATRMPNTCMMHACKSRLQQGCLLLSGFAQHQKKSITLRDPLHHSSRASKPLQDILLAQQRL
jgi:hypothetical protein